MATDNFTGTNNTLLTTHDANWSLISGSDKAIIYNNGLSISEWVNAFYRRTDSTADLSEVKLLTNNDTMATARVKVLVRTSSEHFGYGCILNGNETTWTSINLYKNDTYVTAAAVSYARSGNYTIRVTASGSSPATIKCYIDGDEVLSYNDSSSPYTSGNPGLQLIGSVTNDFAFADDWTDGVSAASALPRRALSGPFYGSLRGSI